MARLAMHSGNLSARRTWRSAGQSMSIPISLILCCSRLFAPALANPSVSAGIQQNEKILQTQQSTLDLNSIAAVVLDMDGVIWRGAEPLPGVPDFFLFLRDRGI